MVFVEGYSLTGDRVERTGALWLLAFPMRTTSCAVNSNLDDVWAGGTEVRKAATADTASWR